MNECKTAYIKKEEVQRRQLDTIFKNYEEASQTGKLSIKKFGCKHINCGHKSKSVKQLLMHHDKLDIECVKEKNLLLQLIIFYQNASINLLENNENYLSLKLKENIGVDDVQNIWINYINNYDLDNELKNESELIELQSKKVIENSINKNQYKGILENF